jgi:hypothetical protein
MAQRFTAIFEKEAEGATIPTEDSFIKPIEIPA